MRLYYRKRIHDVKSRSAINLTEINKLSCDISHSIYEANTPEICTQNDFYGIATVLKHYSGIQRGKYIKASIEHGSYLGGYIWEEDIHTPFQTVITFSEYRKKCLERRTEKEVIPIGPYIHYAKPYLNEEQLLSEKKRLGKNVIVFPAHSTQYNIVDYDHSNLNNCIKNFRNQFDSVRICLYWKDILRGVDVYYRDRGFECVCAGHIHDPFFLSRLKSIIEIADVTMSNQIGTHLGYSLFLGKPHYLYTEKTEISQTDITKPIPSNYVIAEELQADINELEEAFGSWTKEITTKQKIVADKFWGFNKILKTEQLAATLNSLK